MRTKTSKTFTNEEEIKFAKDYIHNDLEQKAMALEEGVSAAHMSTAIRNGVYSIYHTMCVTVGCTKGRVPDYNMVFGKDLESRYDIDEKTYRAVKNYIENNVRLKPNPKKISMSEETVDKMAREYLAGGRTQAEMASKHNIPMTRMGEMLRTGTYRLYVRICEKLDIEVEPFSLPLYNPDDKKIRNLIEELDLTPLQYNTLRGLMVSRFRGC